MLQRSKLTSTSNRHFVKSLLYVCYRNQSRPHLGRSRLIFLQLERKRKEHEMLREHRLQMQKQLESLNMKEAYGEDELNKLTQDLQNASMTVGHQSEPTTPPEYRDGNFQSVFSRANRYSLSSLVSPPGLNNRSSRSGSQLTSPPSEIAQTLHNHINSDTLPSKSVPSSRRGSSDRFSAYNPEIFSTNTTQRGPAA